MAASTHSDSRDPSVWVDEYGDALYRFALLRVRDDELAHDLVQDTFLSALKGIDSFRGGSSVRTWLTGILKHKIIDHYRKNRIPTTDLDPEGSELEHAENLHPAWKESPANLVENREFWAVFTSCLDGIPEAHRRAFSMREFDGLSGEEIRKVLDVTPTNLWVMLHRARTKLRRCLESKWFEEK